MEVILTVNKLEKGTFRPFHEEVGSAQTPDGKEIRVLSTIPSHNFIIVFDGIDYEITSQDIVNAVMNKVFKDELKE